MTTRVSRKKNGTCNVLVVNRETGKAEHRWDGLVYGSALYIAAAHTALETVRALDPKHYRIQVEPVEEGA